MTKTSLEIEKGLILFLLFLAEIISPPPHEDFCYSKISKQEQEKNREKSRENQEEKKGENRELAWRKLMHAFALGISCGYGKILLPQVTDYVLPLWLCIYDDVRG